jgi:hypothetical protein
MISDLHSNKSLAKKARKKPLGYDYAMTKLHIFFWMESGILYHLGLFERRICCRPCVDDWKDKSQMEVMIARIDGGVVLRHQIMGTTEVHQESMLYQQLPSILL